MADKHGSSLSTCDPDTIRRWAEERGAVPTRVTGTGNGGDAGLVRLDFPGYSGDRLEEIPWDEFFETFRDNDLCLVYQETTAKGETSNFNKIVSRESVEEKSRS